MRVRVRVRVRARVRVCACAGAFVFVRLCVCVHERTYARHGMAWHDGRSASPRSSDTDNPPDVVAGAVGDGWRDDGGGNGGGDDDDEDAESLDSEEVAEQQRLDDEKKRKAEVRCKVGCGAATCEAEVRTCVFV